MSPDTSGERGADMVWEVDLTDENNPENSLERFRE
jgi:hypothetical protein